MFDQEILEKLREKSALNDDDAVRKILEEIVNDAKASVVKQESRLSALRKFVESNLANDDENKFKLGLTKIMMLNVLSGLILKFKFPEYQKSAKFIELQSNFENLSEKNVVDLFKIIPKCITWKLTDSKLKNLDIGHITLIEKSIDEEIAELKSTKEENLFENITINEKIPKDHSENTEILKSESKKVA